ncbi:MAG: HEAT repeat domain-containing protein [Planctomycetota bacterium]
MQMSACCAILACAVLAGSPGCAINAEPDFDSAVPQDRFRAIREAKAERDTDALPDLVRQLGSDDALVRLAAIDALQAITDQRLGFAPHAAELERQAGIDRWISWLETREEAME